MGTPIVEGAERHSIAWPSWCIGQTHPEERDTMSDTETGMSRRVVAQVEGAVSPIDRGRKGLGECMDEDDVEEGEEQRLQLRRTVYGTP